MSLCLIDVHGDIEGDFEWAEELPRITNGDVIKALFPNSITRIFMIPDFTYIEVEQNDKWIADFNIEWWNAPYKENKE